MISYLDINSTKELNETLIWNISDQEKNTLSDAMIKGYSSFIYNQHEPFYREIALILAGYIYSCMTMIIYECLVESDPKKTRIFLAKKLQRFNTHLISKQQLKPLIKHALDYKPILNRNRSYTLNPNPTALKYLALNQIKHAPLYHQQFYKFIVNTKRVHPKDHQFITSLHDFLIDLMTPLSPRVKHQTDLISSHLQHVAGICITQYHAALKSNVAKTVKIIYTGTQGKFITRVASLAAAVNGANVSAFHHTGGLVPSNKSFRPLMECMTCTDYYCYTPLQLQTLQNQIEKGSIPIRPKLHILPNTAAPWEHSQLKKIKHVTYPMMTLNINDEIHYGLLTPTTVYTHLHFQILHALIENNIEVTLKLHRKNLQTPLLKHHISLLKKEFGDKIKFNSQPLDQLTHSNYQTDAWICDNVDSGTMIETLKTNKPIILFEHTQFSDFTLENLCNNRVKLIPVYFNERNLPTFNPEELQNFLEKPEHQITSEGLEHFVNFNFDY